MKSRNILINFPRIFSSIKFVIWYFYKYVSLKLTLLENYLQKTLYKILNK